MFDPSNVSLGAGRPPPGLRIILFNQTPPKSLNESDSLQFLSDLEQGFTSPAVKNLEVPSVHLPRPGNWPIKDQSGTRGTCTAFNMNAALEMQYANEKGQSEPVSLSEEYLYSKMRRHFKAYAPPNAETGATFLEQAVRALADFGLCPESVLEYQGPKEHPAWSVSDTRPYDNQTDKTTFDVTEFVLFNRCSPEEVRFLLNSFLQIVKTPVCISLPIIPEGDITPWTYGIGWDTGEVPDPAYDRFGSIPDEIDGHSFCIVGYEQNPDDPTDGRYIFRNSWGEGFGLRPTSNPTFKGKLPRGYGSISASHVHNYCWELLGWFRGFPYE